MCPGSARAVRRATAFPSEAWRPGVLRRLSQRCATTGCPHVNVTVGGSWCPSGRARMGEAPAPLHGGRPVPGSPSPRAGRQVAESAGWAATPHKPHLRRGRALGRPEGVGRVSLHDLCARCMRATAVVVNPGRGPLINLHAGTPRMGGTQCHCKRKGNRHGCIAALQRCLCERSPCHGQSATGPPNYRQTQLTRARAAQLF